MKTNKLNVLFISDARVTKNWGCRGTSASIVRLLDGVASEIESIPNLDKFYNPIRLSFLGWWPKSIPDRRLTAIIVRILKRLNLHDAFIQKLSLNQLSVSQIVERMYQCRASDKKVDSIFNKITACDVVIVNGEGDFIFDPNRSTRFMLAAFIKIAQESRKKVYLINAMFSKAPGQEIDKAGEVDTIEVLQSCDKILVRDRDSLSVLRFLRVDAGAEFCPDALFEIGPRVDLASSCCRQVPELLVPCHAEERFTPIDLSSPYIALGGSSAISKSDPSIAKSMYRKLLIRMRGEQLNVVLFQSCTGDQWLVELAEELSIPCVLVEAPLAAYSGFLGGAEVILSGRYHPSVIASSVGVPIVPLASNSHKMRALQKDMGYGDGTEFSFPPAEDEINKIVETLLAYKSNSKLKSQIMTRSEAFQKELKNTYAVLFD